LVERLLYTQDVGGSSPSPPTTEKLSSCFHFVFDDTRRTLPLGAADFVRILSMFSRARRARSAFCVYRLAILLPVHPKMALSCATPKKSEPLLKD
jgi:hypothetical protein